MTRTAENKDITILIAEDDDGHAELIEDNLRESGVSNRILRFRNGQELLDMLFRAERPEFCNCCLLLLDIRMPKVDGIEVLRRIKQDQNLKALPVIMLTTTDDPNEIQHCYTLGCSSYVTKPVDYRRFSDMLAQLAGLLLETHLPRLSHGSDRPGA